MKITITEDIFNPCDISLTVKSVTTIEIHEIIDSERITEDIVKHITDELVARRHKAVQTKRA